MTPLARANTAAFVIPSALMAGALGSQHIGGLYPCEMCYWQRGPHEAAIALAILAFFVRGRARVWLIALAAVAVLVSGAIGLFHAGVEYGWWPGVTACAAGATGSGDTLAEIMRTPLVSCDKPQWTLAGISLAGFNALFSTLGGLTILTLLRSRR